MLRKKNRGAGYRLSTPCLGASFIFVKFGNNEMSFELNVFITKLYNIQSKARNMYSIKKEIKQSTVILNQFSSVLSNINF